MYHEHYTYIPSLLFVQLILWMCDPYFYFNNILLCSFMCEQSKILHFFMQHERKKNINKRAFSVTKDSILLGMPALTKLSSFSFLFRLRRTPAHLIYHTYAFPYFIMHACLFATSISALTPYLSIS